MITAVISHDNDVAGLFNLYLTEAADNKYYEFSIKDGILVRTDKSDRFSVITPLLKGSKEDIEKVTSLFKEPFKFE